MGASFAQQLFEAQWAVGRLEEDLMDHIQQAFGDFCWEDFTYDWHDTSYEIHGLKVDWRPDTVGLNHMWAQGFLQCWFNYVDKSQIMVYGTGSNRNKLLYQPPNSPGVWNDIS